jgi:netrin receptor unc-5
MGTVVSRRQYNDWVKFVFNVQQVFKWTKMKLNRGQQDIWVSGQDLACKCPKIRIGKKYFIVTHENSQNQRQNGLILDRKSIVMRVKSRVKSRVRKILRRARKRKC